MPKARKSYGTGAKIYLGGRFDSAIAKRFNYLALSKGVSMQEALRRVLIDAIQQGRIPGIEDMIIDDSMREKEKDAISPTHTFSEDDSKQASDQAELPPAGQLTS